MHFSAHSTFVVLRFLTDVVTRPDLGFDVFLTFFGHSNLYEAGGTLPVKL